MGKELTMEERLQKLENENTVNSTLRTKIWILFLALLGTGIAGAAMLITTNQTSNQNQRAIEAMDDRQRDIQGNISAIQANQENTRRSLQRIERAVVEGPPR